MNFWTWLDRNGFGLGCLLVIVLCFGFGTCGDGKGCRVHCGVPGGYELHVDDADGGAR